MSSADVKSAADESAPTDEPIPVNLQQLMDQLRQITKRKETHGAVNVQTLAAQLQRTMSWGNRNMEAIIKVVIELLEKGQKQNLCHKSAENVWKYGPRPKGTESEDQQTAESDHKQEQKQKAQISKKRRSTSQKKKKVTSRKRTKSVTSKMEMDSERVPGGPFRSNLPRTQSNQENRRIRRRRKQSAITNHGFTRKQLMKMLADLDAEEEKTGTEPPKTDTDADEMESEIKPKRRKSVRRGRGRRPGRGRGRSVTANGFEKRQSKRTKSAATRNRKRTYNRKKPESSDLSNISTTERSSISAKSTSTLSDPKANNKAKSQEIRSIMKQSTKQETSSLRNRSKRAKITRKKSVKRSSRKKKAQNGGDSQLDSDDSQEPEGNVQYSKEQSD